MARNNTNSNVLTRGLKYKNNKNKHKKNAKAVEEVTFDKSERLEYLTGFHKRKLERQKNAQVFLKEQARLMKIEERRKLKFEREETVQKQLKEMKEKMKEIGDYKDSSDEEPIYKGEDDEWKGFSKTEEATVEPLGSSSEEDYKPILKKQTIYEDNTEVNTESIETNDNFEFLAKVNRVDMKKNEDILNKSIKRAADYADFMGMGSKDDVKLIAKKSYAEQASKTSMKKKKFRYLTKNERKDNQYKAYKNKHRK
ncbi:hypothetical protein FOG51_03098 [Hanseniaspora uvarum]|uniref:Ribosomal RNA-processing protein 17 n=1 Tax=Hanseniaspora uvarum TaxID=29833 RepID=A0A1E5RU21_HANUV|nr:hypothetical protein FOG48_01414 [Hanseniaspora uvarum]KKA03825.1 Ribosomal RNA-processing protein 17 [Hanseniaspora uvarum DSM 2768]KAF0271717.1 hypothetical protein FOG51_03098 [Hanseniaspora uvarum]KAF0275190.1 hypothetical protein FOG50_03918 [Hanseniaspora uvarum]OEJ90306.1 Ribosomal RNA-processing protein 17 [Hanseniaspora uvarum]